MKNDCRWGKLLGIALGLILPLLAGCGILPDLIPENGQAADPARLEISLDDITPEGVAIVWDPTLVAVNSAEVSVDSAEGEGNKVTVTVELRPAGR